MTDQFRYAAFVSYSSKDAPFARRLHRALETYGIPASLGPISVAGARKRNRIYPVFRDREELAAGQLGDLIEASLRNSAALIVVCSPNGAASPWVQKEIEFFVSLGRRDKIFAIIPSNAPLQDDAGADCTYACFPPAFGGDALAGDVLEPLAADARPGKDGFRNAWLKIVAGLIGVTPGQLIDRDAQRRRGDAMRSAALSISVVLGIGVAASTESTWRPVVFDFFNPQSYYEVVFTDPISGARSSWYENSQSGTDVMFNGIAVGQIANLRLDPENPNQVIARIRVDPATSVREGAYAELRVVGNPQYPAIVLINGEVPASALEPGAVRGDAPRLRGEVHPDFYAWLNEYNAR